MTARLIPPGNHAPVRTIAELAALDGPADAVARKVREIIKPGPVKDALSGSWLGHALHPLLTDVTLGTWTSALLLDWLGGRQAQPAADRLIALGLLSTPPTVAAGYSDWGDSTVGNPPVARIGLVHAATNGTGATLMAASWAARKRGARGAGKLLALAGGAALGLGGYLGGHLSFAEGLGVDQTVFEAPPEGWTDVLAESELAEGQARCVEVGGVPVLVARTGGELHALSNRCAHRGGPLHEGELRDGTITCPWHGSTFDLRDGALVRGPSAYPQPPWEARASGDRIEVRPV